MNASDLLSKKSAHQTQGLSGAEIAGRLPAVPGWAMQDGFLARQFSFKNYYETLAFVNAVAFVIHAEDHHPELVVGYNRCAVKFNTHSVDGGKGGISENDFICAAKINALAAQSFC